MFFCVCVMLETAPRASGVLGKHIPGCTVSFQLLFEREDDTGLNIQAIFFQSLPLPLGAVTLAETQA